MHIDDHLNTLKQLNELEVNPFLLTRIKEQIRRELTMEAPVKWKWSFVTTFVVLLVFNISIIVTNNNTTTTKAEKKNAMENVVNGMHLSTQTDLYNE
jgi:hypothetical protein